MDILPELVARRARCGIAADPLPVEPVQRLLSYLILAPSCANTQPWRIVAVTGERHTAVRQALSEGSGWATRAPLIVVMATKPSLDMRLEAGRDQAYFETVSPRPSPQSARGPTTWPLVGRLDDIDSDGIGLVEAIMEIYASHGAGTGVIAASIRGPQSASQLLVAGADVIIVPFKVLGQMLMQPRTDEALKKFSWPERKSRMR
jgi:nitroreductase